MSLEAASFTLVYMIHRNSPRNREEKQHLDSLRGNKTRDRSFTRGISRKLIRADPSFSRDPAWRCFRSVLLSALMVRSLPREPNPTGRPDRMRSTRLSLLLTNNIHVFRKVSPVGLGRAKFLGSSGRGGLLWDWSSAENRGSRGIMASEETLCVGFSCRAQGGTGGFVC